MAPGRGLQPFQACKLNIQEFNLFDKNDSLIKIVPMVLLVLRSSYIKLRDCNFDIFFVVFVTVVLVISATWEAGRF